MSILKTFRCGFWRSKITSGAGCGDERAVKYFPKRLSTYTCQLKLYFSCGDREAFFRVLEQLKQSDVVIDNETLELIRVFQS